MATFFPGIEQNLFGANVGSLQLSPPVFLGGWQLTANAISFPAIVFPAFNSLTVTIYVTGYGGSDVVSLQFNGDTGANYVDRTVTAAAGGVVLTDTPTPNTTLIRMGLPTAQGRVVQANILNNAARRKVVMVNNQIGSADQTAPAAIHLGGLGLWNNTSAQITSITCLTAGGLSILAGSSIAVYGSF
jgi:hypothetical protein